MWSKIINRSLLVSHAALTSSVVFAKNALASSNPITVVHVTKYVTVTETPTVTAFLDERQFDCPQTLSFCSNVLASWSSKVAFPTLSAGQVFAIQIQVLEDTLDLKPEPHLALLESYVVVYNSPVIVGWYLDASDNLMFDDTGLALGIAPLDAPNSKKRAIGPRGEDMEPDETVVAGASNAPVAAPTYTKWAYGQPEAHYGDPNYPLTLQVMDPNGNIIPLTFMVCKEAAPKLNISLWQLEALYNKDNFFATNTISGLTSASCHPVSLQAITSSLTLWTHSVTPSTTTTVAPTVTTQTTSATPISTTSGTPIPTSPSWTNFPIRVDFAIQNPKRDVDTSTGYYITEVSNGAFYIGEGTDNPPAYFDYNMTKYLVSQETGDNFEVHLSKAATNSTDPSDYIWIDRFDLLGNGTLLMLDGDTVITASYFACYSDETSTDYLLGAAINVDLYAGLDPSCVVVYLVGESSANPASTTVVPTTQTTTTTPVTTMTNLDPNINGCNHLNYTLAYGTTGLANAFATACYCWSYLATTVEATTTEDCTVTVFKDVPTITSVSVSGVLSLASRRELMFPRGMIVRDHELVARNTTPAASDIIVIPTPTDFISVAASIVDDSCQSVLDVNDIATLTITSLDVVDTTATSTTITRTSVQTVCYEATYISDISMTTSLVVVCPASATSAQTTLIARS
ncbi:hypothetical protein TWF694_006500 [Orbilia ellipsospora]|uniref:Uncharacterized protein n=1 Tax=Orbilia ellipsospora TaxID=2528407 RepID=A0AAV9XKQ6_9PEZI